MCLCTIVHVTQHLPTVEVFRFTTVFPGGIFRAPVVLGLVLH